MKKIIIFTLVSLCFSASAAYCQGVLTGVEVDPENVCFQGDVFFGSQFSAVPMEPIDRMQTRLNESIDFARRNPDLDSRPAVRFAINCRGGLGGGFHMAHSSGDVHFDQALIDFFQTVEQWKPAELNNEQVDSWTIVNMVVRDGYIYIVGVGI